MGPERRNKNRGYQKLRVWQEAVELYRLTCKSVQDWPFDRKPPTQAAQWRLAR